MAENRVNASTSNPGSTLEQSAASRQATEEKISISGKEFDRKHQRNMKKLDKLSEELDQFNLMLLSEQVRKATCAKTSNTAVGRPLCSIKSSKYSASADMRRCS